MKAKHRSLLAGLLLVVGATTFWCTNNRSAKEENQNQQITHAYRGTIQNKVSTTGIVEPQNRLELKPPISGRVEEILVKEGDTVKVGQTLTLMSSTERAALLDAARRKGSKELAYWQGVYQATPLIAPIQGTVIVRSVEPGQTVTTSEPVLVLSDRLIVKALVDEVDIGGVQVGQNCLITLDAYPDIRVGGRVDHISYESTTNNNVTIYEVDLLPDSLPSVFRSGMNATIEIVKSEKKDVLLLSKKLIQRDADGPFVTILTREDKTARRPLTIGLSDDHQTEILDGIQESDRVLGTTHSAHSSKKKSRAGNPFMPNFKDRKKGASKK